MERSAEENKIIRMPARQAAEKKRRSANYYDYTLFFLIAALVAFGLIMICSAGYLNAARGGTDLFRRQLVFSLIGLGIMWGVSMVNYRLWKKAAVPLYLLALIFMVLTNFTSFGIDINGSRRWFGISGRSLFQPSELVKLALIIVIAAYCTRLYRQIDLFRTRFLLFLLVIPFLALVTMNNLSAGIIIFLLYFLMGFCASRKRFRFVVWTGIFCLAIVLVILLGDRLVDMGVLPAYRYARIYVWEDPERYALYGGYQVMQGLYAIGSGGIFGRGLGSSIQKLGYVPEASNDMIFSIICEELGIVGAVCLILLYIFLLYRLLVIAANAPDLFGTLTVAGIIIHIGTQTVLHIAVVTNIIPNTGIALPFISYGGTSTILLMTEMGIALSVSRQIRLKELKRQVAA